ncbi:MAG: hypothetical protein HY692_09540 [Cyanobacteria bacterium NC_groundwater_1444_Ag_S-0.65um_54_12]|nr:hypothetical protein [Cyanobacteria bacterium NC_groundwater_1444_Ag_S-0.65um_54_12]
MEILPVEINSPLFAEFIDLPWRIYSDEHAWVPPLKAAVTSELSATNPFFNHGKVQLFAGLDSARRVVGRIAASIDYSLADPQIGHFGYFEAIDDQKLAQMLLTAAEDWLRSQGRAAIHGPVNLHIFNQYRLMTDGFERPPFYGEPRSPRYYAPLLLANGYQQLTYWRSWDIPCSFMQAFKRAVGQKAASYQGLLERYSIERFAIERFDQECAALYPVVLETYAENYGYSAISREEFIGRFFEAKDIICVPVSRKTLELATGELVAYLYTYNDPSAAFIAANGEISQLSLADVKLQTLVLHTVGICKAHRKFGLVEVGLDQVLDDILRLPFQLVIGALVKEGPAVYAATGLPASRSYGIFAKSLY